MVNQNIRIDLYVNILLHHCDNLRGDRTDTFSGHVDNTNQERRVHRQECRGDCR